MLTLKMRSFLVVRDQGQKVQIHIFALERETSCTYPKKKKVKAKRNLKNE
jgi:hypothetical protein